jgi:hypothetical protein
MLRTLVGTILLGVYFISPVRAADNFVCVPPAKDFGAGHGTPVINFPGKWTNIGAHQTVTLCVPIASNISVLSLECARTQYDARPNEITPHAFWCDMGSSCFGGAIYQSVTRQPGGTAGDKICAVFVNFLGNSQDAGFSYRTTKATPAVKRPHPPTVQ